MAAGIVNNFELIKIHVQQCMVGVVIDRVKRQLQPAFKLMAVGQAGEWIVVGEMPDNVLRAPMFDACLRFT